jgi:hypothetical protein
MGPGASPRPRAEAAEVDGFESGLEGGGVGLEAEFGAGGILEEGIQNWLVEPDQLEPRRVPASWMTTLFVNLKER